MRVAGQMPLVSQDRPPWSIQRRRQQDGDSLKKIAKKNGVEEKDRINLRLNMLPACYSAVFIEPRQGRAVPDVSLKVWIKDENEAPGELGGNVCDARCGVKPASICTAG